MRVLPTILLSIACLSIGFFGSFAIGNDVILSFIKDNAPLIATVLLAGLLILGLLLLTAYFILRRWVRRALGTRDRMTEEEIAAGLVDFVTRPDGVEDPSQEQRQKAALMNAGMFFMRRMANQFYFNVTVTVVGGLVGAATLFLLYEQNEKLDTQNTRIGLQTDANITESILLEGARRAALAQDLNTLIMTIREEAGTESVNCGGAIFYGCNEPEESLQRGNYRLSKELEARVQDFATRNTPYQVAIFEQTNINFDVPLRDQVTLKNISPERGQLLQAFVLNKVVVERFDFSFAQLPKAQLQDTELSFVRLRDADLSSANLNSARSIFGSFDGADLRNASLKHAVFTQASFRDVDFNGAELEGADLQGSHLQEANLNNTHLSGVDFQGAWMSGATTEDAWAWSDDQPLNLPAGVTVIICDADSVSSIRRDTNVRPDSC